MIKVLVAGFKGKMGQQTVKMVLEHEGFELVGVYDPHAAEEKLENNTIVYHDLTKIPHKCADVWVDFTSPRSVYENVQAALTKEIHPLVGTTGLTDAQVENLQHLSAQQKTGGLIVPNFGISAVLLMQFAQQAAKYLPDVEIIEMHHDQKVDAPSGTALNTAKKIAEVRQKRQQGNPQETETLPGVRGADYEGMRIHAVRLPGYVAHEQVLFGGTGEALTIRQDSFDRSSFMTGVALAIKKISGLSGLEIGLENIL
ncbi:4-hydroxy-tetrahydrodipicolinate reductase [Ligilactobacillus salitolerans]|uniref:4-hydroxy-tetrahydrodipicolinate reductase n=1 Tax=Ligilactobacillus salitolerans TaxID=1808352 RepID=A0A401ITN8_9LACO|nr:4-hydroxy-tetrahydrodipicolinate reductase [Ligilactobacillus salitolerans]GBG94865.1 4-hydroxy-tetrahydrodipicolinate reductase [Ligilactobacillus salitolerans]